TTKGTSMTLLWQTGLVLRRRILLQGFRRHYVKRALELFAVLYFVAAQVAASRRVPPGGALARMPRIVFPPEPLGAERSNDSSGYRIVYAPQTDYTRRLVKKAFPEPVNEFLAVDSWDQVADKCDDSPPRPSELPRVCVMFSEGADGKAPSLGYSVLTRSWNLVAEKIDLPASFLQGIDPQRHYLLETIMSRVEEAQISLQNKASLKPVPIDLFIRQFPRPSLPQDEPAVFSHMSLSTSLLVLGFAGPFLFRVSSVVNENSAEMKVYGSSKALANVDLEIYEGQLTVLLGQNGAGKTSLINIIAGLQRATVGIVRVRGNDPTINVAAVRETMSFCPQKNFNFSDMTVREHLIYFGKLRRVLSPELQQRLQEVLQSMKLTQEADVLAGRLSDAMQRRLNVAIALMSKPKV
ncbi:ABC transporter, putative, partial [Ixodes scapularis]